MAEPCTCLQCHIRRTAFGFGSNFGGGIPAEKIEPGVMALAIIFGLAIADANQELAARAVALFVRTQNDARVRAEKPAAPSLSSLEVAGHG